MQNKCTQQKDAHIAKLLRDHNTAAACGVHDATGPNGLHSIFEKIENFMERAKTAPPPQSIETSNEGDNLLAGVPMSQQEKEIHLNLILGVLEEKKGFNQSVSPFTMNGIILPSKKAEEALEAEKMRDSETVINMFSMLRDIEGESPMKSKKNKEDDDVECDDDSGSEVVFMDCDNCSTSSEEECLPSKRKQKIIEEFSS
eukprot:Tbor_TRINITY_DN5405_c1_g5::TRINITY_DN5405_c1_g5_i1::g.24129::m.24129